MLIPFTWRFYGKMLGIHSELKRSHIRAFCQRHLWKKTIWTSIHRDFLKTAFGMWQLFALSCESSVDSAFKSYLLCNLWCRRFSWVLTDANVYVLSSAWQVHLARRRPCLHVAGSTVTTSLLPLSTSASSTGACPKSWRHWNERETQPQFQARCVRCLSHE